MVGRKKFEYLLYEDSLNESTICFDDMGEEGWQLADTYVFSGGNKIMLIFYREKPEEWKKGH